MSTGTYGLKLFARNNIFKRGNYKYEILNNLYFGPSFVFSRTTSGRFSQCVCVCVCVCVLCVCVCVFLIFLRRSTMAGNIFTQPPPHNKASYGPEVCSIILTTYFEHIINSQYGKFFSKKTWVESLKNIYEVISLTKVQNVYLQIFLL